MVKDPGQILLRISGPLSEVWAGGSGPARSAIESVLIRNDIDPDDLKASNKQDLVRRGVLAAGPGVPAMELIEDFLKLMRARQLFEMESDSLDYALDNLTEAFRSIGGDLDPVGRATWPPELEDLRRSPSAAPIIRRGQPGQSPWPIPVPAVPQQPAAPAPIVETEEELAVAATNTIFLVHGRDDDVRNRVEVQLLRWRIKPEHEIVILDLQASGGQTLIDKFEAHASRSSFVIVIATPDDVGRLNEDGTTDEPRARQNVIFEMGYFIARLGRERVVVMNGGIKEPSDITGVTYISLSAPNWPTRLGRELEHAGMAGEWLK